MLEAALKVLNQSLSTQSAEAHCDGHVACTIPASARIAAEAGLSMTKKILALEPPPTTMVRCLGAYLNTLAGMWPSRKNRPTSPKEELLVLWTDYFKPPHAKPTPIFMTPFGKQPSCAARSKLKSILHMLKNSWKPSKRCKHLLVHKRPRSRVLHSILSDKQKQRAPNRAPVSVVGLPRNPSVALW